MMLISHIINILQFDSLLFSEYINFNLKIQNVRVPGSQGETAQLHHA
jgi:hypothetical protein